MRVTRTQYHDLPSKATRHRPLEMQLKVLQVRPTPSEDVDQDAEPAISPPEEHSTPQWVAYYRTVDRILGHRIDPNWKLAMRQAAAACCLHERLHYEQETVTLHRDLRPIVSAILCDKRHLHTAFHFHNPHTQRHAHRIWARLETTRRQLREWHERRPRDLAQEQQRCSPNPKPYKSLKHLDKILGKTGHRGITAVHLQDGTAANDPKEVIEEVLNSFKRQHNAKDGELSDYTKNLISHLPKPYNRTQRRDIHRTLFRCGYWIRCCTN